MTARFYYCNRNEYDHTMSREKHTHSDFFTIYSFFLSFINERRKQKGFKILRKIRDFDERRSENGDDGSKKEPFP